MLMKVKISGVGMAVKGISIGANLFTGSYLQFKLDANSPVFYNIGIGDYLNIGGKKGTFLIGHIETEFFPVNSERYPWVKDLDSLIGKRLGLVVSGPLLVDGDVSIKLTKVTKDKDVDTLMYKEGVAASGAQVADTMIKGIARKILAKEPLTAS